jgi:hypothetical protein
MNSVRASREHLPKLGQRLRQRAVNHFSRDHSVDQYEQIMANAAGIPRTDGAKNG